jgi:hypothetical protein
METDIISSLLSFIKKEKIQVKLQKKSDSEFWLESPDKSVVAKFNIDNNSRNVLYDVFATEYDVHLKEKTVRDVEKIDFVAEEHKKWKLAEAVEDIWLVLDEIKLWTKKNNFKIAEQEMI